MNFNKLIKFVIIFMGLTINIILGQTLDSTKFMFPLPESYDDGDSSNIEVIFDANYLAIVPAINELEGIPAIIESKYFIAKVINSHGFSNFEFLTPIYYKDQNDYYSPYNSTAIVRGRTRTPEGVILELKSDDISEIKTSINRRQKIFSLPGIQNGSIFQYEYEIIKRYMITESNLYIISAESPTKYMRFSLSVPLNWYIFYNSYCNNQNTNYIPQRSKSFLMGTQDSFEWNFSCIPDDPNENYQPHIYSFMPKLYFSSLNLNNKYGIPYDPTWKNYIDQEFWSFIEKNIKIDSNIKKTINKIIKNEKNFIDKLNKIFYYVQKNFSIKFESIFPYQNTSVTFKEKEGSSADIALLLFKMLKFVKIECNLAFIRSKSLGPYPREDVPIIQWFNKLLLVVSNKNDTIWIDPLYRTIKLARLPDEDQGVAALLFNKNKILFTTTPHSIENQNVIDRYSSAKIDVNGDLTVTCLKTFAGEFDHRFRMEYKDLYLKEIREKIRTEIVSYFPLGELKNFRISDIENYDTNFTIYYDFYVPSFLKETNNIYYFNPFLLTGSLIVPTLPDRPRKCVIDLECPKTIIDKVTWEIPAQFKIIALPDSLRINYEFGSVCTKFESVKNSIISYRVVKINDNYIQNKYFNKFRFFSRSIINNGNSKILIKNEN